MTQPSNQQGIGGVLSGQIPMQHEITLDTKDMVQLALAVAGGMIIALIVFEAVKTLWK